MLLSPDCYLHQKRAVYCWFTYICSMPWAPSLLTLNQLLGNFYCTPWGELNTRSCLNIKRWNEQCIRQSPTTISRSTGRLPRYVAAQFLHLHLHQFCKHQYQAPQPSFWFMLQHQFCSTKVAPEPVHSRIAAWQWWSLSYLIIRENLLLTRSLSVSGLPAPSQFNPFSSLTFFPPWQVIPWSQMSIAEQLQF